MKPEADQHGPSCAVVQAVFPAISTKWAMPIVAHLAAGPQRFSDLKRALADITQKSLTSALRDLERDGMVIRIVTPTIPPRVDYELTQMGHSMLEPAREMARWAMSNREAIDRARERFAARA